jgi:DNA invertase Pin-like site-specific DNA recombinase
MSTDYQRYSVQNQAATIAAYAQQKNFKIVRTYMDEARSGLRIKGRAGLIELIDDVQSGNADFGHILVYDVSRWGRFQDIDESAYYEFICKQKRIKVAYCAELFDNDGSLVSSMMKHLKRAMAAEFSREFGVKVHAAQSRSVSLGFRSGGPLTFGLHRELVDENRQPKGELTKGQHKAFKRIACCFDLELTKRRRLSGGYSTNSLSNAKRTQPLHDSSIGRVFSTTTGGRGVTP